MKPFQLNPQQLDALANGATKLWFPIDYSKRPEHRNYQIGCSKCDRTRTHIHLGDGQYECTYCRRTHFGKWKMFELGDGRFEDLVYQVDSQLQPGESYFVQEDFFYGKGTHSDCISYVYPMKDYEVKAVLHDRVVSADQMTEAQSQYKFMVTGVEVKQTQELNLMERTTYAMGCYASSYKEWHDSQYPDQPYSSNPTGFLITIERIEEPN